MLWQKAEEFDCTLLWHTNTVRNLGGTALFSVPGRYFLILPCNWNVRGGTIMIQKSHKRETLWENICFSVPKRPFTWLWMYFVCRPCSSTPSPSTSALYLGLMATMISTDFCQNNPHCQFFSTAVIRVEELPNQTQPSHLHHSENGPSIGWYPCFGLNCQTCRAEERQSEWEHLKWSEHLREIKGWWTYWGSKALVHEKFNKHEHFLGYVHWICDKNSSCQWGRGKTENKKTHQSLSWTEGNMKQKGMMHALAHGGTYCTPREDWWSSWSPSCLILRLQGRSNPRWPHASRLEEVLHREPQNHSDH